METMRYQENKRNSKGPIFGFIAFVLIGGALIFVGISNENEPEIVGGTREEVQNLVDIYSKEVVSKPEDEKIKLEDIKVLLTDEKYIDTSNAKFKGDIVLPKITVNGEEIKELNEEIKTKYIELFKSLQKEMEVAKNKFTFKTTYKYYDNVVGTNRILSVTIYQRIIDDSEQTTTTDKVETYNIDLSTKQLVDEQTMAQLMFGKEYKTIIKNSIKDYVVKNNMMKSEDFVYVVTGLENYYMKEGKFHILFNEKELVDKKYKVLDIEIENLEDKE